MKMNVRYVSGTRADRVEVSIFGSDNKEVFKETYTYGYNASYNKQFAAMAKTDYENSIKYKWRGIYTLKPFIGDILTDLCNKYEINKDEINYSGYLVYSDKEYTEEEAKKLVKELFADDE